MGEINKDKKINFGIIGFGIFGEKRLIPGFKGSKYANLIAITKRTQESAQQKAEQYKIPFAYASRNDLLSNPEIDAVFIATPNSMHLEDTMAAAEAGKDIILEKPMGLNVTECERMIEVCQTHHVKLMIAHCMRYNSTVLAIKEKIDNGIIGDLVSINLDFFYDGTLSKRDWLFNKSFAGGGPIFDLGVHCLDNMRFLSNQEVEDVKVIKEFNLLGDVESKAHILVKFPDKLTGTIKVGYEGDYYTAIEVIGTKASARAAMYNLIEEDITLHTYQKRAFTSEIIHNSNCYTAEIDAFSLALLNNDSVPIPASEGLANQKVLDILGEL